MSNNQSGDVFAVFIRPKSVKAVGACLAREVSRDAADRVYNDTIAGLTNGNHVVVDDVHGKPMDLDVNGAYMIELWELTYEHPRPIKCHRFTKAVAA